MEKHLPGALAKVDAEAYLNKPGIPGSAPVPRSERLEAMASYKTKVPTKDDVKDWTPAEWQLYLQSLPQGASKDVFRQLEDRFQLTKSQNAEVLVSWLVASLRAGWAPALGRTEAFLGEVGRMKYLKPLYGALASTSEGKALGRSLFNRYAERYHPIDWSAVESILNRA
ncbi:MAG TPA: leukotriene A4 hydrolase C-terminal domain-containing protein [Archangium sp.]|nr:leukotriene A4 hydrolase C-terminal domain-containing protein [Archangium sp.]